MNSLKFFQGRNPIRVEFEKFWKILKKSNKGGILKSLLVECCRSSLLLKCKHHQICSNMLRLTSFLKIIISKNWSVDQWSFSLSFLNCPIRIINYFFFYICCSDIWPFQPLRTGNISWFCKLYIFVSSHDVSKNLSPRKSPVTFDTYVGSEGICFTPGFPVNGPEFGVLSVFTHVQTATLVFHRHRHLHLHNVHCHCNSVQDAPFCFAYFQW